jgi:phytoene dehydrogenase-like protein
MDNRMTQEEFTDLLKLDGFTIVERDVAANSSLGEHCQILIGCGQILCSHPVDRILQQDGRATGVVVDDVSIHAKRAVIAVAPGAIMQLTGGSGQPRYDRSMTGFRHAPGTMMIHLAMSGLPDWSASQELRNFAYVHIAPSLDQMARCYQQASAGLLPQDPVIVVGQPTAVDSSRAPKCQHILWIQIRMVPGQIKADAADQITATDWAQAAKKTANCQITSKPLQIRN